MDVHPEAIDERRTYGTLLPIKTVGAHQEVAARNPVHGFRVGGGGYDARPGLDGESAAALPPTMAGCTMRDRFRSRRCIHRISPWRAAWERSRARRRAESVPPSWRSPRSP